VPTAPTSGDEARLPRRPSPGEARPRCCRTAGFAISRTAALVQSAANGSVANRLRTCWARAVPVETAKPRASVTSRAGREAARDELVAERGQSPA